MNTIKKLEDILKNAGIEEYKIETRLIIEAVSNLTKEDLILSKEITNLDEIERIINLRAKTKRPVQYLLNQAYFMGEKYIVNESVLIPRDETEILVNTAFERIKNKKDKITILDIGIGSGCISCALAKKMKNYDIEILGVDKSEKALQTALDNIISLDLIRKVIIRKSDLFSKIRDIEKFDLIISNPPYIPLKEKNNLQKEVSFEPEMALFAPDIEGIEFYKKIISDSLNFLKEDGIIAFELGINQSTQVETLLKEHGFYDIEIVKDLASIDRVISAKKAG